MQMSKKAAIIVISRLGGGTQRWIATSPCVYFSSSVIPDSHTSLCAETTHNKISCQEYDTLSRKLLIRPVRVVTHINTWKPEKQVGQLSSAELIRKLSVFCCFLVNFFPDMDKCPWITKTNSEIKECANRQKSIKMLNDSSFIASAHTCQRFHVSKYKQIITTT